MSDQRVRITAKTRRTNRTTRVAAAVIVLALVTTLGLITVHHDVTRNGDPGGRILDQLKLTTVAVPTNVKVLYAHYDEPRIDSCDGRAGTQGWSDAVIQIYFHWKGSALGLLHFANHHLRDLGWGVHVWQIQPGLPGSGWIKRLDNGSRGRIQLNEESYGGWTFLAQAPPVGLQSSGC